MLALGLDLDLDLDLDVSVNVSVALLHRLFHNRNSGFAHTLWGSDQALRQITGVRRRGYSSRHSGQTVPSQPRAVQNSRP